jgi:hypothetical protein
MEKWKIENDMDLYYRVRLTLAGYAEQEEEDHKLSEYGALREVYKKIAQASIDSKFVSKIQESAALLIFENTDKNSWERSVNIIITEFAAQLRNEDPKVSVSNISLLLVDVYNAMTKPVQELFVEILQDFAQAYLSHTSIK